MGCQSSKVSAPAAPDAQLSAKHTLLASSTKETAVKDAVKDAMAGGSQAPQVFNMGKPVLDGTWNHGVISANQLTWDDGTVSQLRIDTAPREMSDVAALVEMTYQGTLFSGELRDDGKIHWNDGDTWVRYQSEAMKEAAAALPSADKAAPAETTAVACDAEQDAVAAHSCESSPVTNAGGVAALLLAKQEAALQAHEARMKEWNNQADEREHKGQAETAGQLVPAKGKVATEASGTQPEVSRGKSPPLAPRKEHTMCCC